MTIGIDIYIIFIDFPVKCTQIHIEQPRCCGNVSLTFFQCGEYQGFFIFTNAVGAAVFLRRLYIRCAGSVMYLLHSMVFMYGTVRHSRVCQRTELRRKILHGHCVFQTKVDSTFHRVLKLSYIARPVVPAEYVKDFRVYRDVGVFLHIMPVHEM